MHVQPTPTQQEVLSRLREDGGRLCRLPGGFWTTRSTPMRDAGIPTWSVDVRTVRAMEAKGLLARSHIHAEEWRDERCLIAS